VKTRIILVEDHESVRRSLGRALRAAGFSVKSFAAAEELLETANAEIAADCLLIDVHLPGLSGQELCTELQKRGVEIPAICMSSDHSERARTAALDAGAVAFLLKPFEIQSLLDALDRAALASRRA